MNESLSNLDGWILVIFICIVSRDPFLTIEYLIVTAIMLSYFMAIIVFLITAYDDS